MSVAGSALVTGASRGIGREIAVHLARRGLRVAVHCREDIGAARATLRSLAGSGHEVFAADLTQPDAVAALWGAVSARFGCVDVLVNNAGRYETHPPLEVDLPRWQSAWRHTLAANLQAPADLSLLAVQAMAQAPLQGSFGRGRIVNISSRGAFRGEPDCPAYAASKAGLNALSQSLAKALAPNGIYVYCIAPGWVETDMAQASLRGPQGGEILAQHPLGRIASADEIALTVEFCALDAPPAMTGSIIDVNGASYLRT